MNGNYIGLMVHKRHRRINCCFYEGFCPPHYTLFRFYIKAVSEASVASSCIQEDGPNLMGPSELAILSLDQFIPTHHQMRSPHPVSRQTHKFPKRRLQYKTQTSVFEPVEPVPLVGLDDRLDAR